MKIYYLVTDNPHPSWGVGTIYYHVEILQRLGYKAFIVHNEKGFKIDWLSVKVPILYYSQVKFKETDIIVVPEVMAATYDYSKIEGKKVLFVQGLSLLFHEFPIQLTHLKQDFSEALIIMPHMQLPVEKFTGLKTALLPPFIAEYFYTNEKNLHNREKLVLIFPKRQQFEYSLIKNIISKTIQFKENTTVNRLFSGGWRLVEMSGYSHEETAVLMKKAMFLISTNTFEAFNTSVPEAMAAGCINICYEAFGPKDFLEPSKNAFVFNNNEAIDLSEKIIDLIQNHPDNEDELKEIRIHAYKTALKYTKPEMEKAIKIYYESIS